MQLLLGVLVANRGRALGTDQLCDAIWGDHRPLTAVTTVQSNLSRLRKVLRPEAGIHVRGTGYALDAASDVLDVDRFERAVARSSQHESSNRASCVALGEALALWRGPAYADFADNPWIGPEAVRLDELHLSVTERWIDTRLDLGDDLGLVADLERLVSVHPLRETLWRQLMLALYRHGRQGEALRRANDLSRVLRDQLGLDLSPAARELEQQILNDDPALRAPSRGRPAMISRVVDLPTQLLGRDAELDRLTPVLTAGRLLTLTGPGGVGKSRLARRLGVQYGRTNGNAVLIELAAVRQADSVAPAVATALDVQQRGNSTIVESLAEVLGDTEQLIILDNCEHVIDPVATLVARLVEACPNLHLLTTSREPLGVPGEIVHTVAPLAVGDDVSIEDLAGSPAVQLYCDRAAAARSGFAASADALPAIAELCRRLDGLPLAIELAAGRARSLGPDAMLERLDRRFSLLNAGRRHVDQRHANLQNLVAWSFDLLAPDEQQLFIQLSVFSGSFGLDAVEAICQVDEHARLLFGLVDRSMVQVSDFDEPRYVLLETLRDFAKEKLDHGSAAHDLASRHLAWFLDLAESAAHGLTGPDEKAWSDRIERDFDNLRAAHSFAMHSGSEDTALRLVAGLQEFSFRKIRYELTGWADASTQMDRADQHPVYPSALAIVAYGHFVRGALDSAIALGHAAIDAADRLGVDSGGLAERALGNSYFYVGRPHEALRWMDRLVDTARCAGEPSRLAHALYMRSVAETSVGRAGSGAAMASEAQDAAQASGSPTALAQARYALGLALESAEPDAGREQLTAAVDLAAAAGNRWVEAFARTEVLWLDARLGHVEPALTGFETVIDSWYRGGDWANQWLSLRHVFGILHDIGRSEEAATVHGALAAAEATYAMPFEPSDAARLRKSVDDLREEMGPQRFADAVARGSAMSDQEVVAYVLGAIRMAESTDRSTP
ncbi:MAG: BTAD domain-containing putative transcriptional regulator [Ilumatobacteraceae bacterium]